MPSAPRRLALLAATAAVFVAGAGACTSDKADTTLRSNQRRFSQRTQQTVVVFDANTDSTTTTVRVPFVPPQATRAPRGVSTTTLGTVEPATTTTDAPRPTTTVTTAPPKPGRPPGESLAAGTYTERSDNTGTFDTEDGSSSSSTGPRPEPERLIFDVAAHPRSGRSVLFEARLVNTSGRQIQLEGGLKVVFLLYQGDRLVKQVSVQDESVTVLDPDKGAFITGTGSVPSDGTYRVIGETQIKLT